MPTNKNSKVRRSSALAPRPDFKQVEDLAYANRILFDHGILDAFGHVSLREVNDPTRFLLSRNLAPALVTTKDILEYDMQGEPIDPRGQASYLERFIHAAIYRARPDVTALVHSHAASLIPFGVTNAKLRALSHIAGFLGEGVPIFEIREVAGDSSDMLITDNRLADALAKVLGSHPVALMRGHGSVVVGNSIQQAVFRSVYADVNARQELQAMALGPVNFLTTGEATKAAAMNDGQTMRPWNLWKARVGKIE
jgi:ribulose-5-phosphate 4-epimerase/fuculose-1-phosphate aldolase